MSKTAQRKREAYAQGHRDGMRGNGFRWLRHPHMEQYRDGFEEGKLHVEPKPLITRIREKFA